MDSSSPHFDTWAELVLTQSTTTSFGTFQSPTEPPYYNSSMNGALSLSDIAMIFVIGFAILFVWTRK